VLKNIREFLRNAGYFCFTNLIITNPEMSNTKMIERPEVKEICTEILATVQNLFGETPEFWLRQEAEASYKLAIILSPAAYYSKKRRSFSEQLIDLPFSQGPAFSLEFMVLANKKTLDRGLLKSDGFEFMGETP
jgi:hypothetical protein